MKFLRYSGFVTVAILWVAMLTGIHRAQLDAFGHWPLSYLGTNPVSERYFSGGLLLAAGTLCCFTYYLSKNYKLSRGFLAALIIGQIGQCIAAVVPYGGEQPARAIHTVAALTLAFSVPILMWRFATHQTPGKLQNLAYRLLWIELASFVVGIGTFTFILKGAPIGQILPALAFHLWIIVMTFQVSKRVLRKA